MGDYEAVELRKWSLDRAIGTVTHALGVVDRAAEIVEAAKLYEAYVTSPVPGRGLFGNSDGLEPDQVNSTLGDNGESICGSLVGISH